MNIIAGQWVLLVLKAGYLSNTTYGMIKWSKYIKNKELQDAKLITNPTDKEAVYSKLVKNVKSTSNSKTNTTVETSTETN
jgi:hypothetical protein